MSLQQDAVAVITACAHDRAGDAAVLIDEHPNKGHLAVGLASVALAALLALSDELDVPVESLLEASGRWAVREAA